MNYNNKEGLIKNDNRKRYSMCLNLEQSIFELGVEEIMVIAHSDCGACHMHSEEMLEKMKARGINPEYIDMMSFCGVDFHAWLDGFEDQDSFRIIGNPTGILENPFGKGQKNKAALC